MGIWENGLVPGEDNRAKKQQGEFSVYLGIFNRKLNEIPDVQIFSNEKDTSLKPCQMQGMKKIQNKGHCLSPY